MFASLCTGFGNNAVHIHLKLPCEVTPLTLAVWKDKLRHCSDPRASWVSDGLQFGFKGGFSTGALQSATENMPSALAHPDVVDEYLLKELNRGSIAGQFLWEPIRDLHVNRFGLIPKQQADEWRMIINLSFPRGGSVNDFIPDSEANVKYTYVDDAIKMIIKCGCGAMMAKFDIKSAYRILPIHTSYCSLFGMLWKNLIFIDLCLAFGLRSACRIFNDFADILEWILKYWALIQFFLHYLDDFFLTGPAGSNVCAVNLEKAKLLGLELVVPLTPEKTIGPSTIELDSVEFKAHLLLDKLLKAKNLFLKWYLKRSGKKKLLSLIGYLQHCCKVIVPACPFL